MSLTSELKNPNSRINKRLDSLIPAEVTEKFIAEHNKILSNASIIRAPKESNLLLVGSAMSHAFYHQVTGSWGFDKPTTAMRGIKTKMSDKEQHHFIGLAETTKNPFEKALIALIMAYYDGVARGKANVELRKVLTANIFDRHSLPGHMNEMALQGHPVLDSIWDVANLIESFHLGWIDGLKSDDIHVNATFAGSHLVNGADAQMISNGLLIDIRTSMLKVPFTKKDLYQQLGYCLLDHDNHWNLKEIVWVYPRHQMLIRWGTSRFNLPENKLSLMATL